MILNFRKVKFRKIKILLYKCVFNFIIWIEWKWNQRENAAKHRGFKQGFWWYKSSKHFLEKTSEIWNPHNPEDKYAYVVTWSCKTRKTRHNFKILRGYWTLEILNSEEYKILGY